MHGPHPHERIRQLNKTVPSKGLMCYQRRLPREGRFMVDLERWIVDVKVACEALEAGAVCHSPPCPHHLVQCLEFKNIHRKKEGREEEEVRLPWCPSLCEIEGSNLGTGHRTPSITHGTISFRSTSPERHCSEPLGTQQPSSFIPSRTPTPQAVRRGSSTRSYWELPALGVS